MPFDPTKKSNATLTKDDVLFSVDRVAHTTTLALDKINFALPFGGTLPLNVVNGHMRAVLRLALLDVPDNVEDRDRQRPRAIALSQLARTSLADFFALLPLGGAAQFDYQVRRVVFSSSTQKHTNTNDSCRSTRFMLRRPLA